MGSRMPHPVNRTLIQEILREAVMRCLPKTDALDAAAEEIHRSPAALRIKEEIIRVGKKLWERQYVDGNGGNISYRIAQEYVICTPTMCSKGDLVPEDFSLINMDNVRVCGDRPHTSEVLLHLEIYKAVPQACAVIHCHPPHATAYAITGLVPPGNVIPEQEVFIGPLAVTPYETPGTQKFAETILPYVRKHNTILLGNHGIVCWADTVTHAEWYAEVLETYCWTLMIASQLGAPIARISEGQASDLLALKKKLGLPDIRFDTSRMKECQLSDLEVPSSIALEPTPCDGPANNGGGAGAGADLEALVRSVTDAVMDAIGKDSE